VPNVSSITNRAGQTGGSSGTRAGARHSPASRVIVGFFAIATLAGCSNTRSLEGSRVECSQDCHGEVSRILHNTIPHDAVRWTTQPVAVAPTDLFRLLGDEVSSGRAVWTSDVDAEIRRRTAEGSGGVSPPILLVSKSTHVYWLHGVFAYEGEEYYAVRHGINSVVLLSQDEFDSLGIRTLWAHSPSCPASSVLDVGKSQVTITPYLCDMGLLAPLQRGQASVVIGNVGSAPVELGDIRTSCGCTGVALAGNEKRLDPGQKATLNVSLTARDAPSVKERVVLTFRDSGSGEELPSTLNVFAYQFPIIEVSQRELPFTPVRQGETATGEFRLSEVKTDRFQVQSLDAGRDAMSFKIDTEARGNGLNRYKVRCEWDTGSLDPGTHGGKITIRTTSKWMPELELPVKVIVQPNVRILPARLSFGTVHTMDRPHLRATIVVPRNMPVQAIDPLNVPPEMTVTLGKAENGAVPVDIVWVPNRPGNFVHMLLFSIKTPSRTATIKLPCAMDVVDHAAFVARHATKE